MGYQRPGRGRVADPELVNPVLKKHLEANGIGCALHYPVPLHLQKCYASLGHKSGDFPVAEKAAREVLSLPIYPELTDAQIQRVAEVIKGFFKSSSVTRIIHEDHQTQRYRHQPLALVPA